MDEKINEIIEFVKNNGGKSFKFKKEVETRYCKIYTIYDD